ncbi:hypothetical protein ACN47E_006203 [Coniothyrium glycines]
MVLYAARGISARLATMPLADTITNDLFLRKGEQAKANCEAVQRTLLDSQLLQEEAVVFPGDQQGFRLHWLGDAPFTQSRVVGAPYTHTHITAFNSSALQALVLHLELSDQTFISGLSQGRTHLKVEVFLNGQLSNCLFVPFHDIRSGAKPLHQVFAGTRIDFLAERPWVILPPEVPPCRDSRHKFHSTTAQQRWKDICATLQQEADLRGGKVSGSVPPTAAFLTALASMDMPQQVEEMQILGGRQFGVIDVVISAGTGKKITSGMGYLKAPQRLMDRRFLSSTNIDGSLKSPVHDNVQNEDGNISRESMDVQMIDVDSEDCGTFTYKPSKNERAPESSQRSTQSVGKALNSLALPYSHQEPWLAHSSTRLPAAMPSALNAEGGNSFHETSQARYRSNNHEHQFPPFTTQRHIGDTSSPRSSGETATGLNLSSFGYSTNFSRPNESLTIPQPLDSWSSPTVVPYIDLMTDYSLGHIPTTPQSSPIQPQSTLMADTHWNSMQSSMKPTTERSSKFQESSQGYIGAFAADTIQHAQQHFKASVDSETVDYCGQQALSHEMDIEIRGRRDPVLHRFPRNAAKGIPQEPNNLEFYATRLSHGLSNSPDTLHSGSLLPPTGMYSVPRKPKPSMSPKKIARANRRRSCDGKASINRLVITGRDGKVLVDHRWRTTQYLPCTRNYSPEAQINSDSTTLRAQQDHFSTSSSSKRWTGMDHLNISTQAQAHTATGTDTLSSWPSKHRLQPGAADDRENLPPHLGLGCKALCLEDAAAIPLASKYPEDVLWETAQLRGARSTNGQPDALNDGLGVSSKTHDIEERLETMSSSPLSSVPTTPTSVTVAPCTTAEPIAQVDGSPERNLESSNVSLISTTSTIDGAENPQLSTLHAATTGQSPLPECMKRKDWGYMGKQPRSPDRLNTNGNPPMNQNCVVAYAESKGEDDKSALRQVRGERQGVFQEDYVVFATRFFVPANLR